MAAFLFLLIKAFLISVFCHNFDRASKQGKVNTPSIFADLYTWENKKNCGDGEFNRLMLIYVLCF